MDSSAVGHALLAAHTRGFLVVEETPTDPSTPEMRRLLDDFNNRCEELGRNRVVVCLSAFGLWRTMIAFPNGPQSELMYVRDAMTQAFVDYLGSEPRQNPEAPEAWYGSTDDKWLAEALAAALVAIDVQPRDPAFDTVHQVHAL